MYTKKGQVTLFIILGLIILVGSLMIIGFTKLRTPEKIPIENLLQAAPSVKGFVSSCVESLTEEALIQVGNYGGYIYLPEESTQEAVINSPYYFSGNSILIPPLSSIQTNIADYIELKLPYCLQDFEQFPFLIEYSNYEVTAKIIENYVVIDLSLPLKITFEDQVTELNLFSYRKESRLLEMYTAAEEITELTAEFNPAVCLNCADKVAVNYGFLLDIAEFTTEEIFYVIQDQINKIDDESYQYRFAVNYRDNNEPTIS
ncbi:MAG TPA: hypothetical protein VJC39_03540 [Candidatus Nanoarchaeia archaeon]|nr:hypothetical protein [Candidatus Nanoarchaeia archaeon]